jgi:hypothetical protein
MARGVPDGDWKMSRLLGKPHGRFAKPGSAHCTLVPYWVTGLGKNELKAPDFAARRTAFCRP